MAMRRVAVDIGRALRKQGQGASGSGTGRQDLWEKSSPWRGLPQRHTGRDENLKRHPDSENMSYTLPASGNDLKRSASSATGGGYPRRPPSPTPGGRPWQPRLTTKRLLSASIIGSMMAGAAYIGTRDEATFSDWSFQVASFLNPMFRLLEPEDAHKFAVWAASKGLAPKERRPDPPILGVELWGRYFSNPVGLAAGFDKNGEALEGMLNLGFGFIEIGSVTPLPQEGNPKPRVFRLTPAQAVINRYGFNSEGIIKVAKRLGAQHGKRKLMMSRTSITPQELEALAKGGGKAGSGLVGVNLGKNKTSEDAANDYVQGVHTLSQYADYLVINVSSPNTAGLRKLQGRKPLQDLIRKVQAARDEMQWGEDGPPPLVVKIAPDVSKQDLQDIAYVALNLKLDGVIVSNTTVSRPDSVLGLVGADETGGLSGKPLFELSTEVLRELYRYTKGKIPLIGCGGVSTGEDAYNKIKAGASLVQLYTALIFEGPAVIPRIKAELAACLERDGYKSVAEAVGADHRSAK